MSDEEKRNKTGPKEDRLNLEMDWEESMKKAIKKERPKDGWPKSDKDAEKDKNNEK